MLTGVMASASRKERPDMIRALSPSLVLRRCSPAAARRPAGRSACAPALSPVGAGLAAERASVYNYPELAGAAGQERFSLWDDRQSRLFTDPRALSAGDILTVLITINDRAKLQERVGAQPHRQAALGSAARSTIEWDGVGSSGSVDGSVNSATPTAGRRRDEALGKHRAVDRRRGHRSAAQRQSGDQRLAGSPRQRRTAHPDHRRHRAADPTSAPQNTISYERIAEARISYGGRGRLTEVQQPPYGQQILDTVLPF